jgi:ATP-binding cassette subfamily B protein
LWQKQSGFQVSADGTTATVDAVWLRALPMFAGLDVTLLETIAEHFVTERFPAGYMICQEGEPGDKFYVVVHGEVRVTSTGPSGTEQELTVLQDGDYFGEIALRQDVPRTATVRTRTPTLLLVLKREQFLQLVATSPQVRQTIDAEIAYRLAKHNGHETAERMGGTPGETAPRIQGIIDPLP